METAIPYQLRRLIAKADASAVKADKVVAQAIREVRAELAVLAKETDIAGSASAREKAYEMIRRRMAKLSKRLDDLLRASFKYAGKAAAERATQETGVVVRYSKAFADEVVGLISQEQGENIAAVFTEKMGKTIIQNLRMAVVSAMRENAVAGGTFKGLARLIDEKWQKTAKRGETFVFTDAGGRVWNTRNYMMMNVRTNAMRVYNDCLCEGMERAGFDLVRVTYGGDPHCRSCFPWEGRILSSSGKDRDFPSYDDARDAGCFHPNCVHTVQAVDPTVDADEIELQRKHNGRWGGEPPEDMDADRYELDIERKVRELGLTREQARVAVDRENLTDEIRNGLMVEDAPDVVAGLTDEQVTKLCPNGNPPQFVPAKGTKKKPDHERWNHGSFGGAIHIKRDGFTVERLLKVAGISVE